MKTAYKFRIYPTKKQEAVLGVTLETCRHLWNVALADRKNQWEQNRQNTSYEDQAAILTLEKQHNPHLQGVSAQAEQDVLRRLKKAMDNFFRRVREHAKKKGYPRFKAEGRYNSFTYPQSGFKLQGTRLTLSKIPGSIRTFVHREIKGKIKTCTIKHTKTNAWYVIFTTEQDDPDKIEPKTAIGVDLGLINFVKTSEGATFEYPKYYIRAQAKQRAANKSLHRKVKGSKNRSKARIKLARISRRVTALRDEFHHQVSRKLVDSADLIVFENLNINGMLKNKHLAKHIQDASWGKLIRFTQNKAERAGKSVVLVDPKGTSQQCSGCGQVVKKDLSERVHTCPRCGLNMCRDRNAALNILTLGLRGIACGDRASGMGTRSCKRPVVEAGSPAF